MAKLKSIFPFFGSIGEVTGYRGPDGVERVRKKSSLDKDRLHRDDAFAASRTAWPYLGMASQAGVAIRHALHPLLKNNKNYATPHRLVGACQKGLRKHHPDRTPDVFNFMDAKGELEGFSLVEGRSVKPFAHKWLVSEPDYATGLLRIEVGDWELSARDFQRSGATHLRWRVIVAALPQGKAAERHYEILDSEWFELEDKRSGRQGSPPQAWVCDVPFAGYLIGDGQAIVAMGIEVAQRHVEKYEVMASVKGFDILRVIGGQGPGARDQKDSSPQFEVDLEDFGAESGCMGIRDEVDERDSLGGDLATSLEMGIGVGFEEEVGRSVPSLRSGQASALWTNFEALVVAGVLEGALAPSGQEGAGTGLEDLGLENDSLGGERELLALEEIGESSVGLCGAGESCYPERGIPLSHDGQGGTQVFGNHVEDHWSLLAARGIAAESP